MQWLINNQGENEIMEKVARHFNVGLAEINRLGDVYISSGDSGRFLTIDEMISVVDQIHNRF